MKIRWHRIDSDISNTFDNNVDEIKEPSLITLMLWWFVVRY